jgi:VWFA-related protein
VRQSRNAVVSIVRLGIVAALTASSLLAQQSSSPPGEAQPKPPVAQPPPPPQQPPQQPPRFTTEANYVRLDVYPSKGGVPVLDLRADEFEVLENGARQKVEAFEHVIISPAGAQSMRVEPNSVRSGEQMAGNPRSRVFAIFLDIPHVDVSGSYRIKEPLIRLLDRILGPDDLVAVMTPEMSASQVTFSRKTEVIADMLRDKWAWGIRHSIQDMDEREAEYDRCFPATDVEMAAGKTRSSLTKQLIERRRERMVLDALRDLVRYLGTVREERKAILAISNGWALFRPDPSINRLRVTSALTGATEPVPGNEPIGVDPVGKLRVGAGRDREGNAVSQTACDKDRMFLASIDDDDYFRHLMDVANRNNASFYPIDPRGLAVFDSDIGPDAPPAIPVDMANLTRRIETLRTLAENTDGIATVNSNDLDKGLRRIADDLSSYYLLGYYSTNAKPDGQYRRISVKVNRPGIEVRARRGYRAATIEEVNASRAAAAAPVPDLARTTTAALARLARVESSQRFSVLAAPVPSASGSRVDALWIAGELQGSPQEFARGARVDVAVKGGAAVAGAATELKTGERAFLVRLPIDPGEASSLDVEVRLTPLADGVPVSGLVKVAMDPAALQPLMFKRGQSTGNRPQPVAGFEFSRTDRLQLQLPLAAAATTGAGRMLDRNAQPLQVPVQVGEKQDPDGQRWLTADATLSPLGAGDYVIEVTVLKGGVEQNVLTAIRVTR